MIKIGSSIKTVKLKIDPVTNKGKIAYLELTRQMINLELDFYNQVVLTETLDVKNKHARNRLETLTHRTKTNVNPKYPLNKTMLPSSSITKRSIIASSLGQMQSYFTRAEKWEKSKSKKGKPSLPSASTMPTFYYSDYKLEVNDIRNQFIALRVFTGEEWEFINYPIQFTKQFATKYEEHLKGLVFEKEFNFEVNKLIMVGSEKKEAKKTTKEKLGNNPYWMMRSPSLSLKKGVWYLNIPFEKQVSVKSIKKQLAENLLKRTLGIDLGIKHLVVITIMEGDKLLHTEFIRGLRVNSLRYNTLKTITRKQKQSGKAVKGERANKKLWQYISNLNEDTAHQVSARIVALAKEYNCQVIVFENLKNFSRKGKSKASRLNLKLNYWLHGKIVNHTRYKAYAEEILTVERSPFMTSQIHYKNNQVGERFSPASENGKSLIMFEDGTVLNADFNASLNLHRKFYGSFPKVIMKEIKQKKLLLRAKMNPLVEAIV